MSSPPHESHEVQRLRGGMLSGAGPLLQDGIAGPAKSGYLDMRPDPGISGLAWLGIASAIVVVAARVWPWLLR